MGVLAHEEGNERWIVDFGACAGLCTFVDLRSWIAPTLLIGISAVSFWPFAVFEVAGPPLGELERAGASVTADLAEKVI